MPTKKPPPKPPTPSEQKKLAQRLINLGRKSPPKGAPK